jgi:mono/diheme cytochrome c family protein
MNSPKVSFVTNFITNSSGRLMKIIQLAFILTLVIFLASCEEEIESGTDLYYPISETSSDTVKFAQVQSLFQNNGCFGCHSDAGYSLGDFNLAVPLTDLINLKSNLIDMNIITPGDPEKSALYFALLGERGMTKMPQNGQMEEQDIDLIKKWIEQGALEN